MHQFEQWRASIVKAKTRLDIAHVVRDYVACLLPSDLAKLPATSQSAIADAATDIAGAAVTLLRDELRYAGDPEIAQLMREIVQTFTAASARLAHLDSRGTAFTTGSTQNP